MSQGGQSATDAVTDPATVVARFDAAYRDIRADDSIQFALPSHVETPTPGWLLRFLEFLATLGPVVQVLFWLGIAVIVALPLWVIYRRVRERDGRDADAVVPPTWQPEAAPARALLDEADGLAAQGRFADAVHLLLHRSLEEIGAQLPDFLRPSLTSRDIAASGALPRRPREAFAEIARAVELSLFGGGAVEEPQWSACRAAYERFAFAPDWRA